MTHDTTTGRSGGESKVEVAKRDSRGLRGTIVETLTNTALESFSDDERQILKFHGIYQQDDRDTRRSGAGKAYSLMVRLRIPGGALTADQWLHLDALADCYSNGTLRLTTRQSIQFHGVLKGNLKPHIAAINDALLSTIAACGDVQRNVMAPAAPFADEPHRTAQRLAAEISQAFSPATHAYHEIWIDGERQKSGAAEEPFYGPQYLPRKFKTGVALDTDNSVDIYTYDCGLVGITAGDRVVGYNLLVGGGLGMTHKKADTFARLATSIGSVAPGHAVDAVRTVVAIFRDHGNRDDRRHARLKYLIEAWGAERFIDEFRRRIDWKLAPPHPLPPPREHDHMGLFDQGDGRQFYGVFVENGRITDAGSARYRSAFREIVSRFRPGVRITPMQSILFTDLEPGVVADVIEILGRHGIRTVEKLSQVRRWSMACPALPTCGLALTESERVLPGVIDALEREFEEIGILDAPLTVRMTGCPNGCSRPYNADIAFVGRKPGVYHVLVGGGLAGDRLADLYAADVPLDEIVKTLRPLLVRYSSERRDGEGLGDFYQRIVGHVSPRRILTGDETPTQGLVQLNVKEVSR